MAKQVISQDMYDGIVQDMGKVKYKLELMSLKLDEKYGTTLSAIISIFCQENMKKMMTLKSIVDTEKNRRHYYEKFCEGRKKNKRHFLVKFAEELDYSPALFAKMILEMELSSQGKSTSSVAEMLRNPDLISCFTLSREISWCCLNDPAYGPLKDGNKRLMGEEYEMRLKRYLQRANLHFLTEEDMRERGYDKTPDVKMRIPFGVGMRPVNWIESKAMFGNEFNHKEYMQKQYLSYRNRFGPGLVIYWFGFVEELQDSCPKDVFLMDHFPEENTICRFNPWEDKVIPPRPRKIQPRPRPTCAS